jgi:hypothetical protein
MSEQLKKPKQLSKKDLFGKAEFDIEHALGMHAISFCTLPAKGIYDKKSLAPLMNIIETCHIYLIGYTPKIDFIDAQQKGSTLELKFEIIGKEHIVQYEIPPELSLKRDGDLYYLEGATGQRYWPNEQEMQARLNSESKAINFEVKYVGQAYGQDGSRNAIDRLLKHESLQKIALKGVPDGYMLTLLLLAVQPNNQLITTMNPFARNSDDGSARIQSGLVKLFNTSEEERISLYEAALIRYFYPEFNKEFKDSFPSTNLKILQDCYNKDFCSVVAEICFDEIPFQLWSQTVKPARYHIARHNLHKDNDRRMFFEPSKGLPS